MEKTINYCWFGKNPLPEEAKKCIASWKKFMPDYEIVEWNENNFDVKQNRYIKEAYENKMYAFVSDYARLKIIYDNGGIYFDIDVELIKPLNEEMLENGYFAKEDKKHINTGLGFAAKKGDKTLKKMLDDYDGISFLKENGSFDKTTCPVRNTNSVEKDIIKKDGYEWLDGKLIYPRDYFAPLDFLTGILKITKNTYSIHFGNASWLDDSAKYRVKKRNELTKKYGRYIGKYVYMAKRFFGVIK